MRVSLYLRGEADIEGVVKRCWSLVAIWTERSQTVTYDMRIITSVHGALDHSYGLLRRTCALLECDGDMYFQGQLHMEFIGMQAVWHTDHL